MSDIEHSGNTLMKSTIYIKIGPRRVRARVVAQPDKLEQKPIPIVLKRGKVRRWTMIPNVLGKTRPRYQRLENGPIFSPLWFHRLTTRRGVKTFQPRRQRPPRTRQVRRSRTVPMVAAMRSFVKNQILTEPHGRRSRLRRWACEAMRTKRRRQWRRRCWRRGEKRHNMLRSLTTTFTVMHFDGEYQPTQKSYWAFYASSYRFVDINCHFKLLTLRI